VMSVNISVVVPVYNSSGTLRELVHALHGVLDSIADEYELVLVNDGSRDNSAAIMNELSERYSFIRPINLMRNYGQHNALLCGVRAARFDILVTLDDDLQNPPEEIPKLLKKLEEGYDVVYGVPMAQQHGLWRNAASQITKLVLQNAMGADNASKISPVRAMRTQLRHAFANYQNPFVSLDVLLTWGTTRFSWVTIDHKERKVGVSNYTFKKLATHALNMVTGFSTLPLQLATVYGFGCVAFGVLVLIYVFGRYIINGGSVPGFPFLASIITIFAGAQLFSLGIIGEYLARMYSRSMERPPYVIAPEQLENQRQQSASLR
jgi:glycosyltransferase involved in cell wall biosynthesis